VPSSLKPYLRKTPWAERQRVRQPAWGACRRVCNPALKHPCLSPWSVARKVPTVLVMGHPFRHQTGLGSPCLPYP
jgi:hypothetical protein